MKRIAWPVILGLLLLARVDGYGQQAMERVYANAETHSNPQVLLVTLSEVTQAANAVDGNVGTHSTLRTNVGALSLIQAWQNLRFTGSDLPSPTTPVTIKLGFGSSVLNLLGGVTVQATLNGTPVGTAYTGSELLGLLGGTNQSEITFTPNTNYNGVRVRVTPTLGVGVTAEVYHAYFLQPAAGPVACNEVMDVLYGVGSYDVNAAGVTGSVTNEWNSVDGNIDTYSTMNIGVQALSYIHQTVIYNNPSTVGDSIRVVISDPGGLLELELLTNFQIQAYLGNQAVGPLIDGSSDLLDIDLLGLLGTPGTKVVASFAPPGVQFDRIQIRLASAAGLLDGIRVHEIGRVAPNPVVDGLGDGMLCESDPLTLTVADPETNAIYHWYDAAEGGSEITEGVTANGTSFTPAGLGVGTHEFYVSVTRNGCTDEASGRAEVIVTINPTALAADITLDDLATCEGSPVVLTPASTLTNPVYTWYKDANKTEVITDGLTEDAISYAIDATGALTITGLVGGSNTTYYAAVEGDEKCENAVGDLKAVQVTVTPAAVADDITIGNDIICEGASAVLSPSSSLADPIFKWYRNPDKSGEILDDVVDGGVHYQIDTDGTLTISNLAAENDYTYYLSVEGTDKCENESGNLKQVTVTVQHPPVQPDIAIME